MISLRNMAVQALAYASANAAVGVHEEGGANNGYEVNFWQKCAGGRAGESWCDDFVFSMDLKAWCHFNALLTGKDNEENRAIILSYADKFAAATKIKRTGSCDESAKAAKEQGRFHGPDFQPSPGDQIFFDLKGIGVPHHTGIVAYANTKFIHTIEGNTSAGGSGSQDNGDGVYAKVRGRLGVYGFMHLE